MEAAGEAELSVGEATSPLVASKPLFSIPPLESGFVPARDRRLSSFTIIIIIVPRPDGGGWRGGNSERVKRWIRTGVDHFNS